jgi:hypothetical protein
MEVRNVSMDASDAAGLLLRPVVREESNRVVSGFASGLGETLVASGRGDVFASALAPGLGDGFTVVSLGRGDRAEFIIYHRRH